MKYHDTEAAFYFFKWLVLDIKFSLQIKVALLLLELQKKKYSLIYFKHKKTE